MRNQNRGTVLAEAADVADTSAKRRTGLLKHTKLEPGAGLWIAPCEAVHSFGMKFAIDVVYLDRKKRVRKVRKEMVPRRLSACLTRPFRPDLAGMIQAGIGFATADMRFEAAEMRRRFPTIELTRIVDVVGPRFGRAPTPSAI